MQKYLFVDFFGTLVKRKIDLIKSKKIWAERVSKSLDYAVSALELFNYRESGEKYVAETSEYFHEYTFRQLANAINDKLKNYNDVYISNDKFYEIALKCQEEVEIDNLQKKDKIINIVKEYKKNGYIVFCVSDNEMPLSSYTRIFKSLNIFELFDEIFVSSEYMKNKRSSSLYTYILGKYDINPANVTMIGDNYLADYQNPKALGMKAILVKNKGKNLYSSNVEKKILNKLFDKGNIYANYSFSLYSFISKLYKKLIKLKINEVIFLSREGQFLKKLFDKYQEVENCSKINTNYAYVSRTSTFLAQLKKIDEEDFSKLRILYPNLNNESFLRTLYFNEETIKVLINRYGNDYIINYFDSNNFLSLKQDKVFVQEYHKVIDSQKRILQNYISNMNHTQTLALVDVGWGGTMQDNIYNLFDGNKKIYGFYLGLRKNGEINENNKKYGLLFDLVKNAKTIDDRIYSIDWHNYELILKADHGQTMHYNEKNGQIQPVLRDDSDVYIYNTYVKYVQEDIYKNFIKIMEVYQNKILLKETLDKLLSYFHLKMLNCQKIKDLIFMNKLFLNHEQSFGLVTKQEKDKNHKNIKVLKKYIKVKLRKLNIIKV